MHHNPTYCWVEIVMNLTHFCVLLNMVIVKSKGVKTNGVSWVKLWAQCSYSIYPWPTAECGIRTARATVVAPTAPRTRSFALYSNTTTVPMQVRYKLKVFSFKYLKLKNVRK